MNFKRWRGWIGDLSSRAWLNYILLLLITLIAAALRLYKLGQWSFWIDEIYTINHAVLHFGNLQLILANTPPARNWVPVSAILAAQALSTWGVNEWSARIASAGIGILTLPILYFPTSRIFGHRITLISLLLLAVSPWHIFWSQNARFYTSLMLFYTLALFAFYVGIEKDRPNYLWLFLILVYLAASERLSALFIYPVVAAYLAALWVLRVEKPKGVNFKNLLLIASPILIGSAIEVYNRVANRGSRFFADFTWFFQYRVDDPFRLLVFIGNDIGVPLIAMALVGGLLLLRRRSRPGLLLLMSAIVPLFILVVANLFIFTKDRYVFISLFSWITLAVVAIDEIASQLKGDFKWLAAGVFLVLFAQALNGALLYYQGNQGDRLQWKTAFTLVKQRAHEEDVIVSFWPEFGPYYLNREITAYSSLAPNTIVESNRRYWFVLDSETIWTNAEVKTWLEKHGDLIEVWYLRRPEDNFLRVYLFDPVPTADP